MNVSMESRRCKELLLTDDGKLSRPVRRARKRDLVTPTLDIISLFAILCGILVIISKNPIGT